jgi:predicted P-loop ATPase
VADYLRCKPKTTTKAPDDDRMRKAQRWTTWRLKKVPGKEKPSKFPDCPTDDPAKWMYFHAARAKLGIGRGAPSGIGFQMLGNSGVCGIDIDNCISPEGIRNAMLNEFIATLEGCKVHGEVSPSGLGVRIFAGETPVAFHDFTNKAGVEFYSGEAGRFLCFTGHELPEFVDCEGAFDPLPAAAVKWLEGYASRWKDGRGVVEKGTVAVLPELGKREDWEAAYPRAKKIPKPLLDFIKSGHVPEKYASASEALFAAEQQLLKYLKAPQAYQVLISGQGSWETALEHREGSPTKAREFIWTDLGRASETKDKREKDTAAEASGWRECGIDVELTEDGARAKMCQINVIRAFEKHSEWLNRLRYDEFRGVVSLDGHEVTVRELAETSAWATEFLKWPFEYRRESFIEAITEASKVRGFNPIETHLRSLEWDGVNRIHEFTEALCEENTELDREILKRWLVGFVARGLKPGCKMDQMLCIRGPEGAYKSTFCEVMAGEQDLYALGVSFSEDVDTTMKRIGKRVIELGEGVATRRADKNELKMDLAKPFDDYRPRYSRNMTRVPRAFVYVLTSNPKTFLRSDQDGLRRIWPIDAREFIDLEWIKTNRSQLLAQAVRAYDLGVRWWFEAREDAPEIMGALRARQESAVSEDALDSVIAQLISEPDNRKAGWRTLNELLGQVAGGTHLSGSERNHATDLLLKHGFRSLQRRIDGQKMRIWTHPDWTAPKEGAVLHIAREFSDPTPVDSSSAAE